MTLIETVSRLLLNYPSININALQAYIHLFCTTGNGYKWENGELIETPEEKLPDNIRDAVYNYLNKFFEDTRRYETPMKIYKMGKEDVAIEVINNINRRVLKNIELIYNIQDRLKDFRLEPIIKEFNHPSVPYKIYISEYSKICEIPDDVKDDWLLGIDKLISILKNNIVLVEGIEYLKIAEDKCKKLKEQHNL